MRIIQWEEHAETASSQPVAAIGYSYSHILDHEEGGMDDHHPCRVGMTMPKIARATLVIIVLLTASARAAGPTDDAKQGAQLYRACAACHSLAPGRNMTGPSLAGVWGRKAGSLESFERYSPALKASGVVWNETTLDRWLTSPAQFIPGNYMTFAGIADARQRADLIDFLKEAANGQAPSAERGGGMMGGMTSNFTDLKTVGSDRQVSAIRVCHDSYFVTTADGKTVPFWEPNLRFKTEFKRDGSAEREAGHPACGDDGRPRLGVLCLAGRDQSLHQAPMLRRRITG